MIFDCPVALGKSLGNPESILYYMNNNNKSFTVVFRMKLNDILYMKFY